ncbi:MAG: hypothetical protein M0Z28_11540 [Rhodospirillales bacterium]|nr:hypothetical protein [Rhodospirillales bacterium]
MRSLLAALLCLVPVADAAAQAPPPHAWLFGAWTGGLFPADPHPSRESCLAQPTVVFMRDIVLRATLTDATYVQRVVATARVSGNRTDFTFAPAPPSASGAVDPLTGAPQTGAAASGFGCAGPDELHVVRKSANEIVFPGCADFPNPLVRCPGR